MELSTAELAFLHAIGENPQDDEYRLIYADWLEDQGDPRAALIRSQCQRRGSSRPPVAVRDPEPVALSEARWRQLLEVLGVRRCQFQRGLVEDIEIGIDDWLNQSAVLRQWLPTVRTLRLRHGIRPASLEVAVSRVDWPTLTTLDLAGCPADSMVLDSLADWPGLARLESLILRDIPLELESTLRLRQDPFAGLIALDLVRTGSGDEALEALGSVPGCRPLRWLSLNGNEITDRGLSDLLTSPALMGLRTLNLSQNQIQLGPRWHSLASLPMPYLKHVDLSRNPLTQRGFVGLANLSGLQRIKSLDLAACGLQPTDLASVLPLRVLAHLRLDDNPLGDQGVSALADSPNFRLLLDLSLARTGAGDIAANRLLASACLPHLQHLNLADNVFSPAARRALLSRFGSGLTL